VVDCPTNDKPALPELPDEDPPLIIEFPPAGSPMLELKPLNPDVNVEPAVLPEEWEDESWLEENEAPVLPELIDCPTNESPALPALPVDDPPRTTEFPPEEKSVLMLDPSKPEVNPEPDALAEEWEDESWLEENEAPELPELIDCPTKDNPALPELPVDAPPMKTELPPEESPVLALDPENPVSDPPELVPNEATPLLLEVPVVTDPPRDRTGRKPPSSAT